MTLLNFVETAIDSYFSLLPRKKPSKLAAAKTCLIAHRGAHDKILKIRENTHAAFARALALGCWGIEFDVHVTADGVLVVNHDSTLERLWGIKKAISNLDFPRLRLLAPELPSLAEVVERYGKKMHLFIELKSPFAAEASLKRELASLVPRADYHLISLDEPVLATLTSFPAAAKLLVAVHNNVSQFCQKSLQKPYGGVLGHYLLLNNQKITELRAAKQAFGVGQVNSKYGLYREIERGLPWIFSNRVALLSACLRELAE